VAVYYLNGFESGGSGEVTTLTSGFSIVGSTGIAGAYGLSNDGTGTTWSDCTIPSKTRCRGVLAFGVSNVSPNNSSAGFDIHFWDSINTNMVFGLIFFAAASGNSWSLFLNGGAAGGGSGSNNYGSTTVALSSGRNILEWDVPLGSGNANVWLNGVQIFTNLAGVYGVVPTDIGTMRLLRMFVSGAFSANVDDIVLDDTNRVGNGTDPVVVISRQFTNATPAADNWTKSNSSTIDTVWNDTPFSASTNASADNMEGIDAEPQSAKISSFANTQTGHGSGTASGSATLLGQKVSFVGKTSSTAASAASLVGTPQNGTSTAGGNVSLSLTVGAAAAKGDVVIVIGGGIFRSGITYGPTTSGYTQIGSTQTSGASGTGIAFGAWYKVMGSTPDTTVACAGTGTAGDGISYTSRIIRGIQTGSVIDVSAVFSTPTTASNPDPPAITPTTNNAVIVIGAASLVSDTNIGGATNYVSQATGNAAATRPYSSSSLHRILSGGGGPQYRGDDCAAAFHRCRLDHLSAI
jgi:hypothetical protein